MVLAAQDKIRRYLGIAVMGLILALSACKEEDKLGVSNINPLHMPTLSTRNVATVISDSGYTKYKVVTPLWNIYSDRKDPFWVFPEGVYLRQLDHDMKVISTVAADSAIYFPNLKLWKLYGNVEIDQKDKLYFFSPRIFFDDKNKKISSDTFIHIKTATQILEGVGFESNMEMTKYRVLKPTGVFPASLTEHGGGLGVPSDVGPIGMPSMDPFSGEENEWDPDAVIEETE